MLVVGSILLGFLQSYVNKDNVIFSFLSYIPFISLSCLIAWARACGAAERGALGLILDLSGKASRFLPSGYASCSVVVGDLHQGDKFSSS